MVAWQTLHPFCSTMVTVLGRVTRSLGRPSTTIVAAIDGRGDPVAGGGVGVVGDVDGQRRRARSLSDRGDVAAPLLDAVQPRVAAGQRLGGAAVVVDERRLDVSAQNGLRADVRVVRAGEDDGGDSAGGEGDGDGDGHDRRPSAGRCRPSAEAARACR
jgi:hypothetical protein